jgi:hypothetical protein
MVMAMSFFGARWDNVTDVSAKAPFDLLCTGPGDELHVEVKGTTGEGDAITLTQAEVAHGRKFPTAVFVVAGIELDQTYEGPEIATGGEAMLYLPWAIEDHELHPISYRCRLDLARAIVVQP